MVPDVVFWIVIYMFVFLFYSQFPNSSLCTVRGKDDRASNHIDTCPGRLCGAIGRRLWKVSSSPSWEVLHFDMWQGVCNWQGDGVSQKYTPLPHIAATGDLQIITITLGDTHPPPSINPPRSDLDMTPPYIQNSQNRKFCCKYHYPVK